MSDGAGSDSISAAGDGTRKRMSRGERYDLILDRAIDVFGSRGYHNVSMDDVAEASGVSKALVYQHFESKDDLYMEVMRSFNRQIGETVLPAWSQDFPPQERFWRGFVAFFEFVEQNKRAWGVLYRDAVEIDDAMVRGIHTLNADLAETISVAFLKVLESRESSDPLLTQYALAAGHSVVGACHALADYWLDHPEETVLRMAATCMAVLWKGFGSMIDDGQPWFPSEEMLKGLL
jgi:AcrR family transcriptional regulator